MHMESGRISGILAGCRVGEKMREIRARPEMVLFLLSKRKEERK